MNTDLELKLSLLRQQLPYKDNACCCVGPQNGEPLCPCQMRTLVVKNGRYVRPEQDFGAAEIGKGMTNG